MATGRDCRRVKEDFALKPPGCEASNLVKLSFANPWKSGSLPAETQTQLMKLRSILTGTLALGLLSLSAQAGFHVMQIEERTCELGDIPANTASR